VPQLFDLAGGKFVMETKAAVARAKDGCQLSYRIYSNSQKPRVALIHSLGLAGAMWDQVIGQLAESAQILVYDCRGHGQSERSPGPYTVEFFADDLAALFDTCGWASAVIAGCSMGGCIAQAFAAKYPERAAALALIDTTAWYGPTAPKDWKARAAKAAEGGLASMTEFQLTRWLSDEFRQKHSDITNRMKEIFLANDLPSYQATCEMLGNADLREAVRKFRVPVSVIVGEGDYATPVAMSQSLHDAIANSTLTIIPGARHLTPVECPDEIAAAVKKLIGASMAASR
jgi:3-oxoadipate enol-lactonase